MFVKKLKVVIATGMLASTLAGVALTSGVASASSKWAMCASAASCGGQDALVAAAKAEGSLNVITIPLKGWANYGTIMKDFTKKYGIKINDANPNGSSAQEITAIQQDKGRSNAPDVVDVGTGAAAPGAGAGPVPGSPPSPRPSSSPPRWWSAAGTPATGTSTAWARW